MYSPFEKKTQESQLDTLMDKMEVIHSTLNDIWKKVNIYESMSMKV